MRRLIVVCVEASFVVTLAAGCSDVVSTHPGTSSPTTTTSVAAGPGTTSTLLVPSSPTTTAASSPGAGGTSPPPADTTAPVPVAAWPILEADGLGPARFGDAVEQAVATLTTLLGAPTSDQTLGPPWPGGEDGWRECHDASDGYGCYAYFRSMAWEQHAVSALFTDAFVYPEVGAPHFAGWVYWGTMAGPQLTTPDGVTIGTSIGALREALGERLLTEESPNQCTGTWLFWIDATATSPDEPAWLLRGTLSGSATDPDTTVVQLEAGVGESC